jgi:hypothetical protein
MRSYRININRLVNQLVPHYLGGRKLVLYLQAILSPLDSLNKKWKEWADTKRIEATMTSQVIILEHFLNRKFSKYLVDPSQWIFISDQEMIGVPLYWEGSDLSEETMVLHPEGETEDDNNPSLYWKDEDYVINAFSFTINCTAVNTQIISENELTAMISYQIKRYCIAGKKFNILYN